LPDESECFVKYNFPSVVDDSVAGICELLPRQTAHHKFEIDSSRDSTDVCSRLKKQQQKHVTFEVLSSSREKVIARGQLAVDKLIGLVDEAVISLNNRSFVVPLVCVDGSEKEDKEENDKYVGQLSLTIGYSRRLVDVAAAAAATAAGGFGSKEEVNEAVLSVGVLRATGLQACNAAVDSNVYVKFSLNFMNKPQESKQTHSIKSSPNVSSVEFFDYFELKCPIVSSYNSASKRTISLAGQLEMGQIIFEIWSTSDSLLGTCIVPLEPLLDTRVGIRGWFVVKPFVTHSLPVLGRILENSGASGGI
jgi:hypothetical protein